MNFFMRREDALLGNSLFHFSILFVFKGCLSKVLFGNDHRYASGYFIQIFIFIVFLSAHCCLIKDDKMLEIDVRSHFE
uniref:Uncharacterized protein n=1 Tax=Glossina palpalis gambiensis TaxID=67801 RepID=A0A1B0B9C0_9MUSC